MGFVMKRTVLTMPGGMRGQTVLCWCCNASGSSSWSCSRRPVNEGLGTGGISWTEENCTSLWQKGTTFKKKVFQNPGIAKIVLNPGWWIWPKNRWMGHLENLEHLWQLGQSLHANSVLWNILVGTSLWQMKGCSCHLGSAWVVASVGHAAPPLLQVVPHHQWNLPHPGVGPGWSHKLHLHELQHKHCHLPVGARGNHAVMGQLVVHCVGEGGGFVLVDRHRWVVREVGLVQHREHWVSWFLSSLMINCLLINRRIRLRKRWSPPMARKGARIPRTSSSLIPANPATPVLSSSSLVNIFAVSEHILRGGKLFPNLKVFPFDRPSPSSTSFCWTERRDF